MHLNADIVFDNLPASLHAKMTGPKSMDLSLRRPELYAGGNASFKANRLYLVNADRVPQRAPIERGCVVVCIGDSPLLERYRKHASVIVVTADADFYRTFNLLQNIFDKYDDWERDLRALIEQHGEVSQLLERSEPLFENHIFAIDADFRILGSSQEPSELVAEKTLSATDGKSLNLSAFDQFLELHDLSMDERDPIILTLLDQTTLNYNLFEEDEYRGCLTIHYRKRPYRPSDKPLAVMLGSFILASIRQLASHAPEGIGSLRQAVQALVEERPLDSLERDVLEAANDGRKLVCMRLKLSNRLEQLPLGYARNALEETFDRSIVFEYHHNSLVAMIDVGGFGESEYRTRILQGIAPFTGSMEMKAGISSPQSDLFASHALFLQANRALDIGILLDAGEHAYFFEDYALRDLVMNAVTDMRLELLFPEGLQRLIEHDAASSTSYVETLRSYLNNNLSVAKTASDLYIHRSTLMERLTRIKRELHIDFDDPDEQLRLRILLKAIQMRDELRSIQG